MKCFSFLIQEDVNRPFGKNVVVRDIENVSRLVTHNNYSGGIYKGNKRSLTNWRKSNVLILDIDEPQSFNMKDLNERLKEYCHIIAPTKSNMIKKGKKPSCERYRLLVFLDDYIYSQITYKEVIKVFAKNYDLKIDTKAIDASHFFFKSQRSEFVNENGKLISARALVDEVVYSKKSDINNLWSGYKLSMYKIPDPIQKIIDLQRNTASRGKFEEFIRILMAQHNLVRFDDNKDYIGEGKIPIPQTTFAKQLRIDVRTFRIWLNLLIEEAQLRLYSSHYGKGWTARKYTALNDLRKAIIESYNKMPKFTKESELPKSIADGEWDSVLFWAAKIFKNDPTPERYFKWARSLPGFYDKPDREHHIQHKWNSVKKFDNN